MYPLVPKAAIVLVLHLPLSAHLLTYFINHIYTHALPTGSEDTKKYPTHTPPPHAHNHTHIITSRTVPVIQVQPQQPTRDKINNADQAAIGARPSGSLSGSHRGFLLFQMSSSLPHQETLLLLLLTNNDYKKYLAYYLHQYFVLLLLLPTIIRSHCGLVTR